MDNYEDDEEVLTPHDFEGLLPEIILAVVEKVTGTYLNGSIFTLPSYINRVYELQAEDGDPLIVKFYRPGRWSFDAILEEHSFITECFKAEIPVIPPIDLGGGMTLAEVEGIPFAVYPKKAGRELEVEDDETWYRLGGLVGRMHAVGASGKAEHRVQIHPSLSLKDDIQFLLQSGLVAKDLEKQFEDITMSILNLITPLFDGAQNIRLHGDCHSGNILTRPGEGLMLIDFDDMAMGPPVQDLWLLLPGHAEECRRQITNILDGYEDFRPFDRESLRLIEPLRGMRIIYFLAWCGRQVKDPRFFEQFPQWKHKSFWAQEIRDLSHQLQMIKDHI